MSILPFSFNALITVLTGVVAFYSLVTGTQRIPYFLTTIYKLIRYVLIFLLLMLLFSLLLSIIRRKMDIPEGVILCFQWVVSVIVFVFIVFFFLEEYHKVFSMRHYYHVTDNITCLFSRNKQNSVDIRKCISEAQMTSFSDSFLPEQKSRVSNMYNNRYSDSISAYCLIEDRLDLDEKLLEIALWALQKDMNLVYLSCGRHPYEFFHLLERKYQKCIDYSDIKKSILLVDAHTNHFGFKEPTYTCKTKALENRGILIEVADWSYVGIHSAIAHGYEKKLKIRDREKKASLLIYDSCYSLTDIESEKLYKMFLKHVVPSERSMGGNITIFAEQWVPKDIEHFIGITVDFQIK